jgi:hypothetical protein
MTALRKHLSSLTDPDADAAAQTRDTLLSEVDIPTGWDVGETDVEIAQDGTQDWFLVAFEHQSDPDTRASVFLLEGSHMLQLYIESADTDEWTDPTQNPEEITAILRHHS